MPSQGEIMTRHAVHALLIALAVAALAGGLLAATSGSGSRTTTERAGDNTVVATDFRTAKAARIHVQRTLEELDRRNPRQLAGFCPLEIPGSVEVAYAGARNTRTTVLITAEGNRVYRITRDDAIDTPPVESHNLVIAAAEQLISRG
jgi:hypothetical protein